MTARLVLNPLVYACILVNDLAVAITGKFI